MHLNINVVEDCLLYFIAKKLNVMSCHMGVVVVVSCDTQLSE